MEKKKNSPILLKNPPCGRVLFKKVFPSYYDAPASVKRRRHVIISEKPERFILLRV